MHYESKVIELTNQRRALALDEDYISLLENELSHIYYVRNYVASQEFIIVSETILDRLPESCRPITCVFLQPNFHVLRRFKTEILQHLTESGQIAHFYRLFNCSISSFFDSL